MVHAGDAYTILASTTDLELIISALSPIPWHRKTFKAYREHIADNIRHMFTDGEMIGKRDSKYGDRCHAANVQ